LTSILLIIPLAANASGVIFEFAVTIDRFTMAYMSWGDHDGLIAGNPIAGTSYWMAPGTAYTSAGYIGLNNFMINGPIVITGTVQIDISTTGNGVYAILPGATAQLVAAGLTPSAGQTAAMVWIATHSTTVAQAVGAASNLHPVSVVHISFPANFVVDVQGAITATAELDSTNNFSSINAATLGDIYIQGFKMTMKTGSWVDIWAH